METGRSDDWPVTPYLKSAAIAPPATPTAVSVTMTTDHKGSCSSDF